MDVTRFNVSCDYCSSKREASFILGKRCVPCCIDCIDLVNNPRESTIDERTIVYKEMKVLIKYSLDLLHPVINLSDADKKRKARISSSELYKEMVMPAEDIQGPFCRFANNSFAREDDVVFKLNFTPEVGADLSYTAVSNGMSFSFKKKMNAMLEKRLYNIRVQRIITNSRNEYY